MLQTGRGPFAILAKYIRIGQMFTHNAACSPWHLAAFELLRKLAYQRLSVSAEDGFKFLCVREGRPSKGIPPIRVKRIAGYCRKIEAIREFSPDPLRVNIQKFGRKCESARNVADKLWISMTQWRRGRDSNLSRFAGVSEAGARRRNPERSRRTRCNGGEGGIRT